MTDDSIGKTGLVLHGSGRMDHSAEGHSYEKERDLLFQLLSSIGKEVKDLKELVHSNMNTHHGIQPQPYFVNEQPYHPQENVVYPEHSIQEVDIEPVEDTPLSNRELMKKNIIDALKRNNGNRKKTAAELDISERTLYRKIKDYGMEV